LKIDFHIHSYFSQDSFQPYESIFKKVVKLKLDGFVVVDHNTMSGYRPLINAFEQYFKDIPEMQRPIMFGGVEYSTEQGHIIVINLKTPLENELEKHGNCYLASEIINAAKKQDAFLILAHPFRIKNKVAADATWMAMDAIEVFNGRSCFIKGNLDANRKACETAKKYNKPIVGGSDAHLTSEIGNAYLSIDCSRTEFDFKNFDLYTSQVYGKCTSPSFEAISQIYKHIKLKQYLKIPKQIIKFIYGILISVYYHMRPNRFFKGHIDSYKPE